MSDKTTTTPPAGPWKNAAARQRWELFHRAIAHAKESNASSMEQDRALAEVRSLRPPYLTVAK